MRLIDADAFDKCLERAEIEATKNQKYVFRSAINTIRGNLANCPTVNQWIPVSERLPCDGIPVNITWVNRKPVSYYVDIKDKHFTATGIYYRGKWFWYSWACEDLLYEYGNSKADAVDEDVEIIAWMPLPEPWKEEEK